MYNKLFMIEDHNIVKLKSNLKRISKCERSDNEFWTTFQQVDSLLSPTTV